MGGGARAVQAKASDRGTADAITILKYITSLQGKQFDFSQTDGTSSAGATPATVCASGKLLVFPGVIGTFAHRAKLMSATRTCGPLAPLVALLIEEFPSSTEEGFSTCRASLKPPPTWTAQGQEQTFESSY